MLTARLLTASCIALALPLWGSAEPARVRREGAQIRGATGFTGAVLASPLPGEFVEVLEIANEWRRVRTPAGREGWVHELFLEESKREAQRPPLQADRPPPPRARESEPTALPRALPFEAPEIEERREGAPPAAMEELRDELARERLARQEAERALLAATGRGEELTQRERETRMSLAALAAELAALRSAADADQAALRALRKEAADEGARLRLEAESSRSQELLALAAQHQEAISVLEAQHDETISVLEARHAEAIAALKAQQQVERSESEGRHAAELLELRNASATEIAALRLRLEDEQDRIGKTFVENCSALHQREMGRKEAEWAAACEQREQELSALHAKELRKVAKESGWEEEFERELRVRVKALGDEQLEEARLRWEAKNRGDKVELDMELTKLRATLEEQCEGRVLAGVNAALDRHRVEMRDSLSALQLEEERRCKIALALVLERNASGPGPSRTPPGPEGGLP